MSVLCMSISLPSVHVYFTSFSLFYFNSIFKRDISNIKDVTCTMWLTTQSTIFSNVGILALLPWNFTVNVLSKFAVCLII